MLVAMTLAEETEFGRMPDGRPVRLFTVWAGRAVASFTEFGARVVSVRVPDRTGRVEDVVLGFDSLAMYLADKAYLGAIVGRFGNRIADGRFSLGGGEYQIPVNDNGNALHGGSDGYDQRVWAGTAIESGVEFRLVSPDGDQGFPGELAILVRYTFLSGELRVQYEAACDAETVLNLTNHTYFNLRGDAEGSVLGHRVEIAANEFVAVDARMIPTGEVRAVEGTAFDLRQGVLLGDVVDGQDEQLRLAGGFDQTFVLNGAKPAARVVEPGSGRTLELETTEPGVQFYSGNFLDGSMPNRVGGMYRRRSGFCLEAQHFPDSPNRPEFPGTVLQAGETWRSETVYRFGVDGLAQKEDKRRRVM